MSQELTTHRAYGVEFNEEAMLDDPSTESDPDSLLRFLSDQGLLIPLQNEPYYSYTAWHLNTADEDQIPVVSNIKGFKHIFLLAHDTNFEEYIPVIGCSMETGTWAKEDLLYPGKQAAVAAELQRFTDMLPESLRPTEPAAILTLRDYA